MKTVLIFGAGVAGPTLAYWLHQHGFSPTIVESAPMQRRGGQAIDIRGVALEVIERMGIDAQVRQARTCMRGMTVLDGDGAEISRTTEATFSSGRLDSGDIELLREDLTRVLYERTCDDVEYLYHDTMVAMLEQADGVCVTFEHAAPRLFDVVIGADGLHSNVRAMIFGQEREFLHSLGMQIGIFSTDNFLALDHWQIWVQGGSAGYGIYPVRNNKELRVTLGFGSDPHEAACHDVEKQKQRAAEHLAHLHWETPRLLDAMWRARDYYTDEMAQIRMPCWSKGRVALLGDAAYSASPLSGQGTSLALVGAYILADELAKSRANYAVAFTLYEERMRPFALINQALATECQGRPASIASIDAAKNAISLDSHSAVCATG